MRAIIVLFATILSAAEPLTFPSTPPTEAKDAAKTFHVLDGFEMQLIAAEPLVTDPVAITYDEDGRAYVCEMNDYPYTDKSTHKPSQENPTDANIGKVRLLTDTDGDGVFDKASVFAEGLSWPTGAACWKGGIFVTATPDVWYLKDTNGDGVADVRKKVFTGLKKLNVQAVMNNPIWGLDHRIYIAGGTNGGEIRRAEGSEDVMPLPKDSNPLPIKRNDFSFDPSTGDVRLESGGARFGNTFDDWGNRFLCNIRNPCQHVVIPHRYLERNPYVSIQSPLNDCAEAGDQLPVYRTSPVEPWRDFRAQRWSSEGSHLPKSELVGAGVVTSSAGITVYRGDAYPKEYRDFAFVADVAGNLFYRMKLVPDGVTFKAVQVDGTKNFCTSDDVWFRPVNFTNAPDGCLHVCDMYREVIEHPWSIPDDIHAGIDLLKGRDRGRIWRLAPKGWKNIKSKVRMEMLSKAPSPALARLLDHPNGWHRETAQRLLFERQDEAAVEPLKSLVIEAKTPQGKVHALWSLHGIGHGNAQPFTLQEPALGQEAQGVERLKAQIGRLPARLINDILSSDLTEDHVRSCAWQLKTEFLRKTPAAYHRFNDDVLVMKPSSIQPGTQALMWAAFALGEPGYASDYYPERLIYVMRNGGQDPWLGKAAELTAGMMEPRALMLFAYSGPEMSESYVRILQTAAAKIGESEDQAKELMEGLSKSVEERQPKPGHAFIPDERLEDILLGLSRGLRTKLKTLNDLTLPPVTLAWIKQRLDAALTKLSDSAQPISERQKKLPWLAITSTSEALARLHSLLHAKEPQEIQLAALDALNTYREPAVAEILVGAWKSFTPALRDKAQLVLLSRTERIPVLLAALESGAIPKTQVSAASRATLGRNKNADIVARVAKLFGDSSNQNRKAVIEKYLTAMGLKSSPGLQPVKGNAGGLKPGNTLAAARGAKVYEQTCMACHRHGSRGIDVGPHLATVKAWTPEQLLTNILDPNREVSPNFALYVIETKDGRTLSGLVMSETEGNVVLKRVDGGQESLLRSDIQSISSTGTSLMPEGVEAEITPEQMADLIEFLRQ